MLLTMIFLCMLYYEHIILQERKGTIVHLIASMETLGMFK